MRAGLLRDEHLEDSQMRPGICAIVLLNMCLACSAQEKHYLLEETTVKGGMEAQFEVSQKDYCAAVVRGGAPSCLVLSPTTFSPGNRYLTLLSFGSFSHYDEGTYTSKGLTPEQAKELSSRRGPTIASNEESAIELELASGEKRSGFTAIVLLTEVHLAAGRTAAFVKLLHDAETQASGGEVADFEVYQTVAGGDTNRVFILRHLHRFAELDVSDPIRAAIPPAKRALFDDAFAKCVLSTSVTVMRYRTDLSTNN
jgi:hypothetical protein